jgi:hypothetical protein
MKLIALGGKLGNGHFAKVDDEDYERVNKWSWRLDVNGYVIRGEWNNGYYRTIYLHRELMNARQGQLVDHRLGNRQDNRKRELRLCNYQENARSQRKKGTNPYKGVSWHSQDKLWMSSITIDGKNVFIGLFRNARHAGMAYDIWASAVFGEFAITNFKERAKVLKTI